MPALTQQCPDEDGLFELALAYFSQNAVLFSGPVADRLPWTGEEASDRRKTRLSGQVILSYPDPANPGHISVPSHNQCTITTASSGE